MSEKEKDTRELVEKLKKLPTKTQERIGFMIEGAALVSESRENEKDGKA